MKLETGNGKTEPQKTARNANPGTAVRGNGPIRRIRPIPQSRGLCRSSAAAATCVLLTFLCHASQAGGVSVPGPDRKQPGPRDVDPYLGLYEGTYVAGGEVAKAEARVTTTGSNSPYLGMVFINPDAIGSNRFAVSSVGGYDPLDLYINKDGGEKGIQYAYYEGDFRALEFDGHEPVARGILPGFSLDPSKKAGTYGFRFTGFVKIPVVGRYAFYLTCDDCGRLSIGDRVIVESRNSWYLHLAKRGVTELDAGMFPVTVDYYQQGHLRKLDVGIRRIDEEEGGPIVLRGEGLGTLWQGRLLPDKLVLSADDPAMGRFVLEYVDRQSPTLGRKPPEGATVLLGAAEGEAPSLEEWTNKSWTPLTDGSMRVGENRTTTVKEFGDMEMHLEFMCPYEPERLYQERGNSGVYVQGNYELQVLDSFGFPERINTCGAVYYIAECLRPATLPPLTWQTYDVVFRAARFAANGERKNDPVFEEVKFNGRVIHRDLVLPKGTYGGMGGPEKPLGPLMLQDHGNPVRYRNIWIKPLEEKGPTRE